MASTSFLKNSMLSCCTPASYSVQKPLKQCIKQIRSIIHPDYLIYVCNKRNWPARHLNSEDGSTTSALTLSWRISAKEQIRQGIAPSTFPVHTSLWTASLRSHWKKGGQWNRSWKHDIENVSVVRETILSLRRKLLYLQYWCCKTTVTNVADTAPNPKIAEPSYFYVTRTWLMALAVIKDLQYDRWK